MPDGGVLLRSGVPTVRFTAKDCFERTKEVVSELLSILMPNAPAISLWSMPLHQSSQKNMQERM